MATSFILSIVFTFIVCKLNLTTGVIPSLNVAAGLLGFTIIKFWMTLLAQTGFLKHHFIQQENTVIQTCVVALYGIAFSSGTASYILSMSPRVAAEAEGGNTPNNVKNLSLVWMICFHFLVSFVGLFSIIALRQVSQCIMLVTRHTTEIQVYLGSSYLHCLGLATFYEFGKHEYLNSFWINLNFIYLFWLIVTILCYMSKYN